MERYFYAPGTLFPYKEKILLQRQREQNGKVFLCSWNIISLQGEDSPQAPEGIEWKGVFMPLEHYFLTRRRFSSSARGNRMERCFYLCSWNIISLQGEDSPWNIISLQGEDSPQAPEGIEWKGIFTLLEHYFLTRRRFSSSARGNRMERYFYAPGTLFPYKEKILLQRQRE